MFKLNCMGYNSSLHSVYFCFISKIEMNLFQDRGSTDPQKLDNHPENFERGREDRFSLKCRDIGDLKKIVIGHNGLGIGPDWLIEQITVKKVSTKKDWYFFCNKWFSQTFDDGLCVRELYPQDPSSAPCKIFTKFLFVHLQNHFLN